MRNGKWFSALTTNRTRQHPPPQRGCRVGDPGPQAVLSINSSGSEALLVFTRDDEGLDHLSVHEVAVELDELAEPEVITRVV